MPAICPLYTVQLVRDGSAKFQERRPIASTNDACRIVPEICRSVLENSTVEKVVVVCVDTKNQPIGVAVVSEGMLNASMIHPRDVFQRVFGMNAAGFFLVHNHPSGQLEPSREDIEVTKRFQEAARLMGVDLLDHIICGSCTYSGEWRGLSIREHSGV